MNEFNAARGPGACNKNELSMKGGPVMMHRKEIHIPVTCHPRRIGSATALNAWTHP